VRLALLIYGDLSLTSGGFLYDRCVVDRLREGGDEVDVIQLPWPGYFAGLWQNLRPIAWPRSLRDYDVIVQDELAHPSLVWRNRAIKRSGVPIVALVHNLTCEQPSTRHRAWVESVESAYLRSVDGAVAVCERTRASVVARWEQERPAAVAYPGRDHVAANIDVAQIEARARETGPLRALFLAQVAPHKGLHRLVDAVARLPRSIDVHVHVVGSMASAPQYAASLHAQLRACAVEDRFQFHGELHGEALRSIVSECQVLASPSDREAYPISVLEAFGHGLVVLLTDQGGTNELLRDGIDGYLLNIDDGEAWGQALAKLFRDRDLLARLSVNARERYLAHGTWQDTAAVFRGLCARLIRARR
jgi:glycosyltransferase involved in cell wall biosynthesis